MKKYNITYSGISEYAKSKWDIKKLEKLINKINVEKNNVWVSEYPNEAPLINFDVNGESLAVVVDSMGSKQ